MSQQKSPDRRWTKLHRRADVHCGSSSAENRQAKASPTERLMREIRVHRIELEMQNEALSASRAEVEATRRKYERLYRKYAGLFDFAPIGYLIVDRDGVIAELNLAAAIMLDAPRSTLNGRRISDFIHRDDQDGFYFQKLTCQKNLESDGFELKMIKADSHFFDARLQIQTIYINGTSRFLATVSAEDRQPIRNVCNAHGYESIALIPIVIDNTAEGLIHVVDRCENRFPLRVVEMLERVATRLGMAIQRFYLQQKLNESLTALNAISRHLITVQENEQRRIAMELYDGCGQDLNVLKLRLKGLQDRLPADATDLIQTCDQLLTYSDKIINDIRNIAYGLKPATLDVLGLAVASRQMLHEFSSYSKIAVETNIDLLGRIYNPMDQVCLYRIFHEALTNIHKHARASWVRFAADREGNKLRITIQDNGVGFDTRRQPDRADGENGLGLSTLKLRCQMIGARLSIQSKPGKGTRLTICLPWPQQTSER